MLESDQMAATLQTVFNIPVDAAARSVAGAPFPDWQVIANGLVDVVRTRGAKLLGICGSQGSGKSTLSEICTATLDEAGISSATLSIDDFYLTKADRARLGEAVHPLLATRGVPGTHDTDWLARVLGAIVAGRAVAAPRFDKGLDDRAGEHQIEAEVLVLEGWCVGVTPEPAARLAEPCNELEANEDSAGTWRRWVNAQIGERYAPLWPMIDFWVRLKPPTFAQVYAWRAQQELQLPPERRMDSAAIRRFVQHYERLTLWQWACPPPRPGLSVELAADHTATRVSGTA